MFEGTTVRYILVGEGTFWGTEHTMKPLAIYGMSANPVEDVTQATYYKEADLAKAKALMNLLNQVNEIMGNPVIVSIKKQEITYSEVE